MNRWRTRRRGPARDDYGAGRPFPPGRTRAMSVSARRKWAGCPAGWAAAAPASQPLTVRRRRRRLRHSCNTAAASAGGGPVTSLGRACDVTGTAAGRCQHRAVGRPGRAMRRDWRVGAVAGLRPPIGVAAAARLVLRPLQAPDVAVQEVCSGFMTWPPQDLTQCRNVFLYGR